MVDFEDEYEWWTKKQMITELGPELTGDLIARHLKEDPKKTGKFIKLHLCSQIAHTLQCRSIYSFE